VHGRIWFRAEHRDAIAESFDKTTRTHGYTCWACAVCSNHAHVAVRTHRDRSHVMWQHFADESCAALRGLKLIPDNHPLWSARPYDRFKYTPDEVRDCVGYVEANPEKEGLPRQTWPFVVAYDGWPFHKRKA
jgi:hypothetical protein